MANWIRLTDQEGETLFVNIANASHMAWSDLAGGTNIYVPGGKEALLVKEDPEEIIHTAGQLDGTVQYPQV